MPISNVNKSGEKFIGVKLENSGQREIRIVDVGIPFEELCYQTKERKAAVGGENKVKRFCCFDLFV